MVYIIILIALMCLAFTDYVDATSYRNVVKLRRSRHGIFYLIVLILILIAGLRYYTGFDYESYVEIFNKTILGMKVTSVEWGYRELNKIFSSFMDNSWGLFFFVAFATLSLKAFVIRKESKGIFLSLLIAFSLYFMVGDMGQIRSSLAQSIDFLAIYMYMKDGSTNKLIAFALVLFGSLFHVSSLCMIIIFFVTDRKFNNMFYVISYAVLALVGHFLDLKTIGAIGKSIGGSVGNKLYAYTMNPEFVHKVGLSFNVLFDLAMLIFILYMKEKYNMKENRKFNILFNTYFLGISSYLIFNNYFVLGVRFANYFRLALILLIPMLIKKIENKRLRMFAVSVIILLFALMVIRYLDANISMYVPYRMNLFGNIIGG